jgi:uncharacterized phiE125 gp8 family phage protein
MTLKLINGPAEEPVSLALAKLAAKVEHSVDDELFTQILIPGVRRQAEHELNRPLITQEWERVLDAFPCNELKLGKPPVQSIVHVKYIDVDGVERTLASSAYSLDADTDPGWLCPAIDTVWPDTLVTANAVRVRFLCGYGAAAAVDASIKDWMLVKIATGYRFREQLVAGMSIAQLPGGYMDAKLDPFRYYGDDS